MNRESTTSAAPSAFCSCICVRESQTRLPLQSRFPAQSLLTHWILFFIAPRLHRASYNPPLNAKQAGVVATDGNDFLVILGRGKLCRVTIPKPRQHAVAERAALQVA